MPVSVSCILQPQKSTPRKLGRKYQSIKSMFIVQLHYMAVHHFICILLVLKIIKPFKRISFPTFFSQKKNKLSIKKLKKLAKFKLLLIQTWNHHQYEYDIWQTHLTRRKMWTRYLTNPLHTEKLLTLKKKKKNLTMSK